MISLKQASERVGKTKPTLLKAIKSGRMSANKNENGEWEIDPSELLRAYPMKTVSTSVNTHGLQDEPPFSTIGLQHEIDLKNQKIISLEEKLRKSEEQCEKWEKQAEKVTMLLSNQNPFAQKTKATASEVKKKKGFFRRLFG